jgi:hypothetical protein
MLDMDQLRLISPTEAARLFGMSYEGWRRLEVSGQAPVRSIKLGARRRYRLVEVRAFLEGSPAPEPLAVIT